MPATLHALLGLAALAALAWALSEDRRRVPWRTVLGGFVLALALAALCLKLPAVAAALASLNGVVEALDRASEAGTALVFGYLGGGPKPFPETDPAASFVLAFRALPIVLVTAALSALLFHLGVLPAIVRGFSRVLRRTLGNQSKAARTLNLSRGALIAKIKEYGLPDYRHLRRNR